MVFKKGDLIKWFSHHAAFEASLDSVRGVDPIYRHGIIIEVSELKKTAIVVHCFDCDKMNLVILDSDYDYIEVMSTQ
tara:strand:+ start:1293 stop:1523 length:231 start_codon:yes stop_codon:yes gene_type:complete